MATAARQLKQQHLVEFRQHFLQRARGGRCFFCQIQPVVFSQQRNFVAGFGYLEQQVVRIQRAPQILHQYDHKHGDKRIINHDNHVLERDTVEHAVRRNKIIGAKTHSRRRANPRRSEAERLGKHLHAGGLSVFAPEIRGYSYGMPAGDHENWLAQACDCVQRLRLCHKTVSVVGISMGATLALAVAEEERIDSLVMLSAALGYDGWAMPWYAFLINMLPLVPFKQHYQYREAEPFGVKNREMRAMVRKSLETDLVSEAGGESITLKHLAEGMRLIKRVR